MARSKKKSAKKKSAKTKSRSRRKTSKKKTAKGARMPAAAKPKTDAQRLRMLEKQFERQGGRGVDLAEEIDELRRKIARSKGHPLKVDFDDEQAVLTEVAKELDEDELSDLSIEAKPSYTHTGVTMYEVTGRVHEYGRMGTAEWNVYEDEEAAENEARARVREDLEEQPEIFNQSFIESHIDMKALEKWVYDAEMESDYVREMAENDPEDFWKMFSSYGNDTSEYEDTEGELPGTSLYEGEHDDVPEKAIETVEDDYAKAQAQDPMQFLEDIYGKEEAVKKAIEFAGIDIDAAVDEAISADGWAHFMNTYDGDYHTTPSGFVYFRVN